MHCYILTIWLWSLCCLFPPHLFVAARDVECLNTGMLRTENVHLPLQCPSASMAKRYVAVNATIWPVSTHLHCLLHFHSAVLSIPSVVECQKLVNVTTTITTAPFVPVKSLSPPPLESPISSSVLLESTDQQPTDSQLDLSLADDRHLLIIGVHKVDFSSDQTSGSCSHFWLCAPPPSNASFGDRTHRSRSAMDTDITRPNVTTSSLPICHPALNAIRGSCYDSDQSSHYFVMPLTYELSVGVDLMRNSPSQFSESVHFVASIAYRLRPTEFVCPAGLFACDLQDEAISTLSLGPNKWQYRLCLPWGLWCDGVVNCPGSGSDEIQCGTRTPPVEFPYNAEVAERERTLQRSTIGQANFVAYKLSIAGHSVSSIWFFTVVMIGVFILCVVPSLVVYFTRRRQRCRQGHRRACGQTLLNSADHL